MITEIFQSVTGFFIGAAKSTITGAFAGGFTGVLGPGSAFIIMVFLLFVFFIKRAIGFVFTLGLVSIASAMFPIIMGYLGFSIPFNLQTATFFVVLGMVLYIIFSIGRFVYNLTGSSQKKVVVKTIEKSDAEK
jgi:predicted RND superfamily exporter protein